MLAIGLIFGGAVSATAENCSSSYACWWVNGNWTGTSYGSALNQSSWPSGIDNKDKSTHNNGTSGQAVHVYQGGLWVNPVYCVRKGSKVFLPTASQNMGSSHNWKDTVGTCF
ncbi:peptidase inhibitor family I36 protein [Oerskovia sp. KBS0722]|uniref:peptidase inhibitor family I36 protein n=1 Tax=Oerskovia sp. KBS0722 TaxID=1179673 RepID=UPI00110DD86C|nr:peptidase inhibitor family I36 protein [Oerskovia sp. KBS0722]QDW62202.1 hypothetical protein FFI11_006335 [Oerskovia sp. KBS0722]